MILIFKIIPLYPVEKNTVHIYTFQPKGSKVISDIEISNMNMISSL